jgi:hypothetical protein
MKACRDTFLVDTCNLLTHKLSGLACLGLRSWMISKVGLDLKGGARMGHVMLRVQLGVHVKLVF